MEKHYPRYPEPNPFPDNKTALFGNQSGEHYTLSEEDRGLWVDLTPYMNQTPFLIQEEAPFVRAYRLFRMAGLRHLVVVNRHNNVRGIITRRELEDDHCARRFRLAKNLDPEDLYPLGRAPPVGFFRQLRRNITRSDQVKRALNNRLMRDDSESLPR